MAPWNPSHQVFTLRPPALLGMRRWKVFVPPTRVASDAAAGEYQPEPVSISMPYGVPPWKNHRLTLSGRSVSADAGDAATIVDSPTAAAIVNPSASALLRQPLVIMASPLSFPWV